MFFYSLLLVMGESEGTKHELVTRFEQKPLKDN